MSEIKKQPNQAAKSKKSGKKPQKERAKQETKKSSKKILIVTLCILLAVSALVAATVLAVNQIVKSYLDSGKRYRSEIAYQTEHHQVNCAMLSYFLYDQIKTDWLDRYGFSDVQEMKDTDYSAGGSYFDRAVAEASVKLYEHTIFAEAATASGMTLSDKELSRIENKIKAIELSAENKKMSTEDYIFTNYGRGICEEDIRNTLNLVTLSEKYQFKLYMDCTPTAEELDKKVSDLTSTTRYYYSDYYMVDFDINKKTDEAGYQEEHDRVYALVKNLSECATLGDFVSLAEQYLTAENTDETGTVSDDFDLEYAIDRCKFSDSVYAASTDEISKWSCDPARQVGDTLVTDGTRNVAACFMVRPYYSIDVPIPAVRVIRLDINNFTKKSEALTELNDLKNSFKESDGSEKSFIALVSRYSHDGFSAEAGGLVMNTYATAGSGKSFDATLNTLMKSWLSSAEAGEVSSFSGNDALYFVYKCKEEYQRSYVDAKSILLDSKFREAASGCQNSYPPEIHEDNVDFVAPLVIND